MKWAHEMTQTSAFAPESNDTIMGGIVPLGLHSRFNS